MAECIPNIGPEQRRRRLRFGWVTLGAAALLAAALHALDASAPLRTLVFVPLYAAGLGFFQYRAKT